MGKYACLQGLYVLRDHRRTVASSDVPPVPSSSDVHPVQRGAHESMAADKFLPPSAHAPFGRSLCGLSP